MPAYVISETTPTDPELVKRYRDLAAQTVALYDGRYIARNGELVLLEGEWPEGQQAVIIEFPSLARAREWYASPEYARALEIASDAVSRRLFIVDGLAA